jgi:hypothetical protein
MSKRRKGFPSEIIAVGQLLKQVFVVMEGVKAP